MWRLSFQDACNTHLEEKNKNKNVIVAEMWQFLSLYIILDTDEETL